MAITKQIIKKIKLKKFYKKKLYVIVLIFFIDKLNLIYFLIISKTTIKYFRCRKL